MLLARMSELGIGEVPYGEDCAQTGTDGYMARARKECTAFINQLRRVHGPEPDGAHLFVKSNPHDFGSYLSVEVKYEDCNETAEEYALKCEGEAPERWDAEARVELGLPAKR